MAQRNAMTKICVIGGRLQGTEALYLAGKAGIETILCDRSPSPLGKNFCGRFICRDVVQYTTDFIETLKEVDLILPTLENEEALATLVKLADAYDLPLVHDAAAYAVTASKERSDALMRRHGLPCPRHYPDGKAPYIAKPSVGSGSEGVLKLANDDAVAAFGGQRRDDWILEEFLAGPSYSLEVIGTPGRYVTYHPTELFMDAVYDCKRVLSRPDLPADTARQLREDTVALAEMVKLHGIMDVEVIDDDGLLKILEIDARLPSQTPIAVYHATGVNMVAELMQVFGGKTVPSPRPDRERFVALEHIAVDGRAVTVCGEHILASAEPLTLRYDFCGADEALTDYAPAKKKWVATLITVADSAEALAAKRAAIPAAVAALLGTDIDFTDPAPAP